VCWVTHPKKKYEIKQQNRQCAGFWWIMMTDEEILLNFLIL
jgi:hypothetical protein